MTQTILIIALIIALAAAFVFASMWMEERKRRIEETNRRWQEISLHSMSENELERLKYEYDNVLKISDRLEEENINWHCAYSDLQDRLSSALCPSNNHIWIDGFCKRCGRKETPC